MFQVFDATVGGERFGFPAFWNGYAYMRSRSNARQIADATAEDAAAYAEAIYAGSPLKVVSPQWTKSSPSADPKALAILDFEGETNRDAVLQYLQNFRAAAPNLRVGYYPTWFYSKTPLDINRDWVIGATTPSLKSQFTALTRALDAAKEYTRPVMKYLDCLLPDCYLLGETCFQRDLNYLVSVRKLLSSYDKAIYPFIWGIWHPGPNDSWNPAVMVDGVNRYPRPTEKQFDQLIKVLRDNFEGCVVWGDRDQNEELIAALKRAGVV